MESPAKNSSCLTAQRERGQQALALHPQNLEQQGQGRQGQGQQAPAPSEAWLQSSSEQDFQRRKRRNSQLSECVVAMKARYRRDIESDRRWMMVKVPLVVGGVVLCAIGVVWQMLRTIKNLRNSH